MLPPWFHWPERMCTDHIVSLCSSKSKKVGRSLQIHRNEKLTLKSWYDILRNNKISLSYLKMTLLFTSSIHLHFKGKSTVCHQFLEGFTHSYLDAQIQVSFVFSTLVSIPSHEIQKHNEKWTFQCSDQMHVNGNWLTGAYHLQPLCCQSYFLEFLSVHMHVWAG